MRNYPQTGEESEIGTFSDSITPLLPRRPNACTVLNRRATMKNASKKASCINPVSWLFWAVLVSVAMNAGNAAEPATDPESKSAEELAKETQNPVANLISVPFQNNFNFGIGPNDATQWVMNVQPVIPITLNKDWNLITRTIMPIINQPSPASGIPSAFGLATSIPACSSLRRIQAN
jgi:hypothetical protein